MSDISALDTDLSTVSASDNSLASAKAIKAYVDSQVTAQDLDFQGDSGGALSIDLDSEVFTISGDTGISTVGSGNTIEIDLDDTASDMTATNSGVYGSQTAIPVIKLCKFISAIIKDIKTNKITNKL